MDLSFYTLTNSSGYAVLPNKELNFDLIDDVKKEILRRYPKATNLRLVSIPHSGELRVYFSLPEFEAQQTSVRYVYNVKLLSAYSVENINKAAKWAEKNYPGAQNIRLVPSNSSYGIYLEFTWEDGADDS